MEDPTRDIVHLAHLLRVHENLRIGLKGVLIPLWQISSSCAARQRREDVKSVRRLQEGSAEPELCCIACQAGQRTFCLRLGNQPCLRWEERRVKEYEIRRRWWIGEAGRSFFPSVSPSKSQMSATVALTSTAITGTKPKTETRSTVAERAKDKFLETSLSCWVGHPWSHFRGYNLLTPPSSKE